MSHWHVNNVIIIIKLFDAWKTISHTTFSSFQDVLSFKISSRFHPLKLRQQMLNELK